MDPNTILTGRERRRFSIPEMAKRGAVGLVLILGFWACGDDSPTEPGDDLPQEVDPSEFTNNVTNEFMPLEPGAVWIYEGEDDGEIERVVVEVTEETRNILGVECIVVRDRVWADGELVEDTFDWFAQHESGDVWYFGEDSKEIEDGEVVSNDGSWEAGVDEARAGILMKGDPKVGDEYQQEFYEDEAEDRARVLALDQVVQLQSGSFSGCLQTQEWSPLEPGVTEHKFYAPGVGPILEAKVEGGDGRLELVDRLEPVDPVNPGDFRSTIDNSFAPYAPGTTWVYEGESDGESERIVVEVTNETKTILGVTCVVVRDRVWVDDELVEDTFDWFAQHENGDVWYFGEDSKEIENGEVISTEGSWEAGVDGARPGILMLANPQVGDRYQQEFLAGEAEDKAEVLGTNETASVEAGLFTGCLRTREWTPLEAGVAENKIYAPGVGMVLETVVEGGQGRIELVEITRP